MPHLADMFLAATRADWLVKVHDVVPPMLSVVCVPNLRSILPIFDLLGLCEPLHAYVQASELHPFSPYRS